MIFFPVWDLSDFWMTCHHVFNRKMGCSVFSLLLARNKISVSENENHFVVDPSVTNTSQFTLYTKTTHTKTDFHVKTRARHLKCRSHFPPFSQQTILRLIPFKLHLSLSLSLVFSGLFFKPHQSKWWHVEKPWEERELKKLNYFKPHHFTVVGPFTVTPVSWNMKTGWRFFLSAWH